MKLFNVVSLAVAILFSSPLARADVGGAGVGDGGHGIMCSGSSGPSVQFLDVAELWWMTWRRPDLGEGPGVSSGRPSGMNGYKATYPALIRVALVRSIEVLGPDHPFVQRIQREIYRDLSAESDLEFAVLPLQPTRDMSWSGVRVDEGCEIVQIAQTYTNPLGSRTVIDRNFWMKLDGVSQALVLLHERLHGWFSPELSTRSVRQAVVYLTANREFRIANRDQFRTLVESRYEQFFVPTVAR